MPWGVLALIGVSLSAQAPDRSKAPAPGPAPALTLPAIQKRQLSNGLPVWIVQQHEVPIAQLNLVVRRGSADDPSGKFGIASMTASMLTEGAGARSALEIADAIDFLGADISTTSGIDSTSVRLEAPVARLSEALSVMADVALRPSFPSEELERVRQERLTSLLQARDSPETIASLAFARVLYGPAHRYGTATIGTEDTIRGFTRGDLLAFYTSMYRPDNATLVVVGDVQIETIMPLLETSFGTWTTRGSPTAPVIPPAPPTRMRREVYLVDKPGAPQSQIRIGAVGVARSTPDFFPIQVMNTMLGGAFGSRLNLNLREKRGYTYGAGSFFDMRLGPGPFTASAGVQADKTAESLTEFFNELNGILAPPPADELERTRNYVALRFPAGFETIGAISARLEQLIVYDQPDDYFSRYVQNIQAIGASDVQRVARRYVQPDRVAVVVVGDLKTTEPRIRALDLGPIRIMTIDEVFAPASH